MFPEFGWIAFFVLLVILAAYRRGERGRRYACDSVMNIAHQRIEDLSTELRQARKDKHEAIQKQFEAERGAVAIRNSVIRDEKNRQFVIRDDALAMNDKMGDGKRILTGKED